MHLPTTAVDADLVDAIRALVTRLGLVGASRALGLSRQSLAAMLAGLPVRRGTVLVLREALAAMAATPDVRALG